MGAADGLLINGSLNNGASTPFALPRGIGNNRPRPRGVYSYAAGFQMGNSAWDARPFSLIGSHVGQAVVRRHAGVRHVPGADQSAVAAERRSRCRSATRARRRRT